MATDDVTLPEVVRRLDTISAQLSQITATLAANERHYDEKFVSSAIHARDVERINDKIVETNKDVTEAKGLIADQQKRTRQTVIALLSIGVPSLISIILTIITLIGSGVGA
ncbi:hypothetical protein [Flexivirga sp.]|uniref:hypothetical protein n=1 Tax=Flexivirga sp. TaxID=1962927 RepID=UPI003F7D1F8D